MIDTIYSFDELSFSSQLIRDLINQSPQIEQFVGRHFDLNTIQSQVQDKQFSKAQRELLYTSLKAQNAGLDLSELTKGNLASLKEETTYTITTGHQLNLMTGPLYSIYKVVQVLKLTQELKVIYPKLNFIPVFWIATEDHDFEEINHLHLFNQKIEWQKQGQENYIAGAIQTKEMESFLAEIDSKFSDESAQKTVKKLTDFYRKNDNLASATRALMNYLFGEYGLVIIDGNDKAFKASFLPVIKAEIENEVSFNAVSETNVKLAVLNYQQQVFARECNLFYIEDSGERVRIAKENSKFSIGSASYTTDELLTLAEKHPEKFSPNALLRPVYQETILPNLVYVGGGGEIAYWLQLKELFKDLKLTFPMLRVRDSILILNQKQVDLLAEYDISLLDLKLGVNHLVKDMVLAQESENLNLDGIKSTLTKAKIELIEKATAINQGLDTMIEAEFTKFENTIDRIEGKMIKAEKAKFEQAEKKIEKLSQHVYPNGGFQERYESFIPYFVKDQQFINQLMESLPAVNPAVIRILLTTK